MKMNQTLTRCFKDKLNASLFSFMFPKSCFLCTSGKINQTGV